MNTGLLPKAQTLAALLPPLLIEAEQIAQTVLQGIHGRRRAGVGETFWQYRRYEQGDPAERIDWRQSSRTDKIFIREREYEAAQNAYVWADNSGSMHYTSDKTLPTKAERAQLIMLALTNLLLRGGEKVTWMEPTVTAFGKNGLEQIAAGLEQGSFRRKPESSHAASTAYESLPRGRAALDADLRRHDDNMLNLPPDIGISRHARIILASDFLMPLNELQKKLGHYAAHNQKGILVHILDPMEENFTLKGRLEIQGLENEEHMLLPNAEALREAYHQRMNEHKNQLSILTQSVGWHYTSHVTSELPHLALQRLYSYLDAGRK